MPSLGTAPRGRKPARHAGRGYTGRMNGTAARRAGAPRDNARLWSLPPLAATLAYPFLLDGFHGAISGGRTGLAALALAVALLVPLVGLVCAWRMPGPPAPRRLAYAAVMAPTLYVFMGVLTYMVKARLPDELIWCGLWLILAGIAWASPARPAAPGGVARWRVTHGVTAAVIVLFVLFHVTNHLFGLFGFGVHDAVRELGEVIYRAPVIEPLLALLLVFQTITGVRLFWHWSGERRDFFRTFQLASGLFLAAYVIGHMDSVFVFARSWLGTTSDFAWAAGMPQGMLLDAWNIRLLPHYLLGVFFVLAHLASGARVIALAHGVRERTANRAWAAALALSAVVAITIILAMTGWRIAA